MNEKGVSPLIATVLIIGFTVALAAIIITWGGRFVQQAQEDVETRSNVALACSRLNFKITKVECDDNGAIPPATLAPIFKIKTVSLSSNTDQDISGFKIRTTDETGDVFVEDFANSLSGFGVVGIDVSGETLQTATGTAPVIYDKITKVEAIAKVSVEGSPEVCQAGIEEHLVTSSDTNCL